MTVVDELTRRIRHLRHAEPEQRDPYHEVVASIAAMHPSKQFGQATVRLYAAALRDVPIDELRERVWELVRTRTFPPTIHEVLEYVVERRAQLPGIAEAWEQAWYAIMNPGKGLWTDLPEPVKRAAESVGGPYTIKTSENLDTLRAHFYNAYREFRAQTVNDLVLSLPRTDTLDRLSAQREVTRGS